MAITMWEQYKRTALVMQATILLACVGVYFMMGRQPLAVLVYFAVMQAAALFGAAWGASLKQRREMRGRRDNRLPLER
jgi:hypothetical protein